MAIWPFRRRNPPAPDYAAGPPELVDAATEFEPETDEPFDEPSVITVTPLARRVAQMLEAGWSHNQVVWVLQLLEVEERRVATLLEAARLDKLSGVSTPRSADSLTDIPADRGADTVADKADVQREKWRQQKANQRRKRMSAGQRTDNVQPLKSGRA
jgi:hypothetical protein